MEQDKPPALVDEPVVVLDPFKVARERLKAVQELIVVAADKILAPMEGSKIFMRLRGGPHGEVAQDVYLVARADYCVPIPCERFVHLIRGREGPVAVPDDVFVPKVEVCCKEDHGASHPLPFASSISRASTLQTKKLITDGVILLTPFILNESDREYLTEIRRMCRSIARRAVKLTPERAPHLDGGIWFADFLWPMQHIGIMTYGLSKEFRDATRDEIPWGFVALLQVITWVCEHYQNRLIEWDVVSKDLPTLTAFCDRWLDTGMK
jgi:hypothetical protein